MRVGDNVISDGVLRKPQLVCITSPQNLFWSWCQQEKSPTAAQIIDTLFIVLCPLFFALLPWPTMQGCRVTN